MEKLHAVITPCISRHRSKTANMKNFDCDAEGAEKRDGEVVQGVMNGEGPPSQPTNGSAEAS